MHATFKQFLRKLARGPESEDAHVHFHRGPAGPRRCAMTPAAHASAVGVAA